MSPLRISILVFLLIALSGTWCAAQEQTTVEPSDAQLELNEAAVSASLSGDHATAIDLFKASLELGALNITYLNMGRAYAALNECAEAEKAYVAARKAPAVAEPGPDQINALLDQYLVELKQGCVGNLVLSCSPPDMEVTIDDQPPIPCPVEPIAMTWGAHVIVWGPDDDPRKARVHIEPDADTELHLDHPHIEIVEVPVAPPKEKEEPSPWMLYTGASAGGVGVALLATALVLDIPVTGSKIDDYERAAADGNAADYDALRGDIDTLQNTSIALYATGSVLAAAGTTFLILYFLRDDGSEAQPAIHLDPGDGVVSVGLKTHF